MNDEQKARYKRAYDLRAGGMTYAEVGREIGVSLERARQLAVIWPRLQEQAAGRSQLPFPKNLGLSVRTTNCIINARITSEAALRDLMATAEGRIAISATPNFGNVSLNEILAHLGMNPPGPMKSADVWARWKSGGMSGNQAVMALDEIRSRSQRAKADKERRNEFFGTRAFR